MQDKDKNEDNKISRFGVGMGIPIGAGIGTVLFATTGDAFWIGLGTGIGLGFGITFGAVWQGRRGSSGQ